MFRILARNILRYRFVLLPLILLFTLFMGYMARDVKLSYKPAPLIPKNDSTIILNKRFEKIFGRAQNIMVIGVTDSSFFNTRHLRFWVNLEDSIRLVPGVEHVFSLTDAVKLVKDTKQRKFIPRKVLCDSLIHEEDMAVVAREFANLPFYNGLLYNADEHTYLMLITLNKKLLTRKDRVILIRNILDRANRYEEESGNTLHFSGLPYIRVTVAEMVKSEMYLFVFLAVAITSIILLLLFRSVKIVLISMLVVGVAVVWSLGTLAIFGYDITLLTAVVPPLLIIIGVPNCIYLINKYHQEFYHHGNKIKALYRIIIRIGSATFLTNLTTAAGFATFIVTKTQILKEFGVIASINVVGIFVISLVLIPIIFSIIPAPNKRHLRHLSRSTFKAAISRIVITTLYRRKTVFTVTGVVLLIGIIGISLVRANGYMVDDVPRNHPVLRDLKYFESHFTGIMPLEIVYNTDKKNGYLNASVLSSVDRLQRKIARFPEISKPLSMVEFAKFTRQAYYNGNASQYKLPSSFERAFILSYIPRSIGSSDMVAKLVDSTGQYIRIVYNIADIGSYRMNALLDSINSDIGLIFRDNASKVKVSGGSVVVTHGINYLVNSLFISLGLAILVISLTVAWLFRKFRMVVFTVSINMIPLILTAATMGYFGINLKPSTVIVFSIAFGIAVDNSIHFLSKYRQELRRTAHNVKESVIYAIRETGISMIYTSVVLFFGFGVFAASRFGGTQSLGILVAITLLFAVVANLLVLPSVLLRFDRFFPNNEPREEPALEIATGFEDDNEIEKLH